MEKLRQELKDSKRYEYELSGAVNKRFSTFKSHTDEGFSVIIVEQNVETEGPPAEKIQVVLYPTEDHPDRDRYGGVVAEIYQELSLEELERLIDVLKKSKVEK